MKAKRNENKDVKAVVELDKMIQVVARKMRVKGAHITAACGDGSWHTDPNCSLPCVCS